MAQRSDVGEVKRILAAIVQVAGGTLANKTNLFKAYYWAHLFYWQESNGLLTRRHRIVRMPNGPGVAGHDKLLRELVAEGFLEIQEKQGYTFRTLSPVEVGADEERAIRQALAKVQGKTAIEVSDESHAFSRSWNSSGNGEGMNIYLDLLSDTEYEQQAQLLDEARREIDEILG
jgi:hypothetical protein